MPRPNHRPQRAPESYHKRRRTILRIAIMGRPPGRAAAAGGMSGSRGGDGSGRSSTTGGGSGGTVSASGSKSAKGWRRFAAAFRYICPSVHRGQAVTMEYTFPNAVTGRAGTHPIPSQTRQPTTKSR